jgi:excisionase family DNA binding protein
MTIDLLDIRAVAALLGVSPRTVMRLTALPYYKIGRCRRYDRADVLAFVRRTRVAA